VKPTFSSNKHWSVPQSCGLIGWLALKRPFNSANNNVLPAQCHTAPWSAVVVVVQSHHHQYTDKIVGLWRLANSNQQLLPQFGGC
jgi:hypothetical protein